jgi:uncharacterized protein (DUF302 family)
MVMRMMRICSAILLAFTLTASSGAVTRAGNDGIVRVRSAYPIGETIARLKKDIAEKGIRFFAEIDQSKLAAEAGIKLQPSVLLIFGNPPLGTQFITANANAGLDWPVRLLVFETEKGEVWTAYTDFNWIARRHGEPQRPVQNGVNRHRLDHVERDGEVIFGPAPAEVPESSSHSSPLSTPEPIGISVRRPSDECCHRYGLAAAGA